MSQQRNAVVAALQQRLDATPEPVRLAQFSSELGHAIARDQLDAAAAADLSRRMVRWGRSASEADRAYVRALEDVLGSVSAALADDEERAAIEHAVESKRDCSRVIALLAQAPRGPNELAKELGDAKNNGRITKMLGELESLGLVQASPSANGKSKPRRLTARGHRVAQALGARSPSVAETESAPIERVVGAVFAMLQLARHCGKVSARELLAAFGGADDEADRVHQIMCLAERYGLVDVLPDGGASWLRDSEAREERLRRWDSEALREAFAVVPAGSVLVTELEEGWRSAMRRAQLDKIANVFRPTHGHIALSESLFPACVVDDPTYVESVVRDARTGMPTYVADLRSASLELVAGPP